MGAATIGRASDPAAGPGETRRPALVDRGDRRQARSRDFLDALRKAEEADGDLAMELTTLGGDAEMARRIVLEIGLARSGSAAASSSSARPSSTPPESRSCRPSRAEDRWLTAGRDVLIHCRQLDKTIEISGPIRASLPSSTPFAPRSKPASSSRKEFPPAHRPQRRRHGGIVREGAAQLVRRRGGGAGAGLVAGIVG